MKKSAGRSRTKISSQAKGARQLPESKMTSRISIITTSDLKQTLNELGIRLQDDEAQVDELLEDENAPLGPDDEDIPLDEMPDKFDHTDDDEDFDDAEQEYPELDMVNDDDGPSCRYMFTVDYPGGEPRVILRQAPRVNTTDKIIADAIKERCERMADRASEIARVQRRFFEGEHTAEELVNFSQADLLEALNQRWQGRKKEEMQHLSRVLDSLLIRVPGWGELPARFFLKQYSRKSGLTAAEAKSHTINYLQETACLGKRTRQAKAEGLVEWLREQGHEIDLKPGKTAGDTYKTWINLIRDVEKTA